MASKKLYLAFQQKIRETYDKIIADINSDKGKIKLGNKIVFHIHGAIRKKDIYAAVAAEVGMGCTERMAEKHIHNYLKEKSGMGAPACLPSSTGASECAPISFP